MILPLSLLHGLPPAHGSAEDAISNAFGQQLGAPFDLHSAPFVEDGPEHIEYAFTPVPSARDLVEYRVIVTPLTYKVHSIVARAAGGTLARCRRLAARHHAAIVRAYIDEDHPTLDVKEAVDGTLFVLSAPGSKRSARVGCSKRGQLIIERTDAELAEVAAREQAERESLVELLHEGKAAEALPRLKAMAARGDPEAARQLGLAYSQGLGLAPDEAEARKHYTAAAAKGLSAAQYALGTFELLRNHVAEALPWLRKAAERGIVDAQENLAQAYRQPGPLQDDARSLQWFIAAAREGRTESQFNACGMYVLGRGAAVDLVQAWYWCDRAAAAGHDKAARNRQMIEEKMTPAQLSKATKLRSSQSLAP